MHLQDKGFLDTGPTLQIVGRKQTYYSGPMFLSMFSKAILGLALRACLEARHGKTPLSIDFWVGFTRPLEAYRCVSFASLFQLDDRK